ncbi:DUF6612 family protein [Pseudogracilibacillus sp. SE30717A]|uniref:DUF6612 family protein n=1 Tax=Pseudogracilibacillus sp. SE30717A TaxID=3098293 RepID=UPI00300DFE25
MNKKLLLAMLMSIFILGGCSSVLDSILSSSSPEDILSRSEKSHSNVESVEVTFNDTYDDMTNEGIITIDIANDRSSVTVEDEEEKISLYFESDDILVEYDDGDIESWGDTDYFANIENMVEFDKNPVEYYKALDPHIFKKFNMEEKDDQYIFTFTGSEEDIHAMVEEIVFNDEGGLEDFDVDSDLDSEDMKVDNFELILVINNSTYLVEKVEQNVTFTLDGEAETVNGFVHQFSKYDAIDEIKSVEPTIADGEGLKEDIGEMEDFDEEELKVFEEEASAYVDALIQATVFQNEEEFIKKAPDSMSKSDKEDEAEIQKHFFKEMYIENTKTNMEGTGVTDKEISDLADAFLKALSKTKYEIVSAEAYSPENIVVTISIQGIDDAKVYDDTEDQLYDAFADGEFDEEDVVSKNMEILINNYNEVDSLLDAVEVDVDVTRQENGAYLVIMQDQFLIGGFVQ